MNHSGHGLARHLFVLVLVAGCGSVSSTEGEGGSGGSAGRGGGAAGSAAGSGGSGDAGAGGTAGIAGTAGGPGGGSAGAGTAGGPGGGTAGGGPAGGTSGGGIGGVVVIGRGGAGGGAAGGPGGGTAGGAGGAPLCIDTVSDAKNCGKCGHDCLGGRCELSVCQPVPLASDRGRLFVVSVDASYVYFGGDGVAIGRVPKATGTVVPLTSAFYAYDAAIAGNRLYWGNDWEQKDMQACALPDCAGGPIGTGVGKFSYYALVADPAGANIYWSSVDPAAPATTQQSIQGMTVASASKRPLVTGIAPSGLAADANYVYFSNRTGKLIERVTTTGTGRATLAISPTAPDLVAVCGAHLYWSDSKSVYTTPLPNGTGTAPVAAFGSAGQEILGLTCDEGGVYWTNHASGSGTITMCPHSGCGTAPKVIALGQDLPWGITADAAAVYWVTEKGGVFKVAK